MTSNFFAALDDSDDEGVATPLPIATVSKGSKPVTKKVEVVEPSKVDESKRPNQNDRNTKFGRGGRAPARDGKRAYDRHSGTGRGKEIKKEGGGARNWGSDKNEARHAEHVAVDDEPGETEEKISQTPLEQNDENEPVEIEPEPEPEPEDNTMSYEEYLAQQKEKTPSSILAPIKTRDVVVDDEFKHLKPKQLVEEDFLVMGGNKQRRTRDKKGEKAASDVAADLLSFRVVTDSDRQGRGGRGRGRDGPRGREGGRDGGREGGRGGREGGRGGRDGFRGGSNGFRGGRGEGFRGRGRGGRGRGGRGDVINVMDEAAFPSL